MTENNAENLILPLCKFVTQAVKCLSATILVFALIYVSPNNCPAQNNKLTMDGKEKILRAFELAKQKKSCVLEILTSNELSLTLQSKLFIYISQPDYRMEVFDAENRNLLKIISVGKTIYKGNFLEPRKWSLSEKSTAENINFIGDYGRRLKLMKNVEFVGEEKMNNLHADLYEYDFDLETLRDGSYFREIKKFPQNRIKIWISSSGLPLRMEYTKKFEISKGLEILKTEENFRFDEEVKIVAPSN